MMTSLFKLTMRFPITGIMALIMVIAHFNFNVMSLAYFKWQYPYPDTLDFLSRLITGHFIHSDLQHLIFNLCGLLLLGCYLEKNYAKYYVVAIIIAITGLDSYLIIADIDRYCGFSGVLNALFVMFLWFEIRATAKRLPYVLIALAYMVKLAVESISSNAIFTQTAWPVFPDAHFVGALSALILLWFVALKMQTTNH